LDALNTQLRKHLNVSTEVDDIASASLMHHEYIFVLHRHPRMPKGTPVIRILLTSCQWVLIRMTSLYQREALLIVSFIEIPKSTLEILNRTTTTEHNSFL
jgi:hypothetical protein